ncbi:hypothetical protein KKA14_09675 [bacterium]|nr:hypothetical protein [bacterium]
MNRKTRVDLLKQVYKIYDDFSTELELACKVKCSACCTRNVTLTSLEGYGLIKQLESENKQDLLKQIKMEAVKRKFQPQITTNQMADMCSRGENIPDEEINPGWGKCPLLTESECPVYDQRPFECRSFSSAVNCVEKGTAEMDPFTITVNTVFRQFIEHMDKDGVTGNLTDLLLFLNTTDNREIKEGDNIESADNLIRNHPAKILMIPPEHTEKIRPIYNALQGIKPY